MSYDRITQEVDSHPFNQRLQHDVATIVGADMEQHGYIPERIGLNLLCTGVFMTLPNLHFSLTAIWIPSNRYRAGCETHLPCNRGWLPIWLG